jgi:hypothetical protein
MTRAVTLRFLFPFASAALAMAPSSGAADVPSLSRTAPVAPRAVAPVAPAVAPRPVAAVAPAVAPHAAAPVAPTLAPSLVSRTQGRTVQVGGRAVAASEYLTKTPRETPVTLRSGRKTTMGALLDSYARLDAALKQHGASLDKLSKRSWVTGGPPMASEANPRGTAIDYPAGDHNRAQRIARDDVWGASLAPYSHFSVQGSDPATADSSACTVNWDAGLKLYTKSIDIVKVVGSAAMTGGTPQASIQIYILGKSEFVGDFNVDGDPPFDKAISTSQLPGGEPSTDMDVIPGVLKVHAVAGGSAYVKLDTRGDGGSVQLSGNNVGFFCRAGVTPTLRTEAHLRADSDIGPTIAGLPALTVSAHGSMVPLELDIPTTVTLAIHDTPPKIGFGFVSKIHVRFMTGTLKFTWQLPDVCVGGNCIVADGLNVNTSGELMSFDETHAPLDAPIANQDPGLGAEVLVPR